MFNKVLCSLNCSTITQVEVQVVAGNFNHYCVQQPGDIGKCSTLTTNMKYISPSRESLNVEFTVLHSWREDSHGNRQPLGCCS